jgi:hypothetical protein
MDISFNRNKRVYKAIFILLCVICLAVLNIDLFLFWENIQIEEKIQLLIKSF